MLNRYMELSPLNELKLKGGRMQKIWILIIILLFIPFSSAFAQDDAMKELLTSKTLKCTFTEGRAANWKERKLKIESDLSSFTIIYDNIDLQNKTARSIGNIGATDETLILTGTGITFIEQTIVGNLIFTTIFPILNREGDFIAVMSRHMEMIGIPMPSQYHGSCKKMPSK